ncbi:hypothetical protein CEW92_03695 [Bacillaceae bacterium SAS-127]|nr:hypothetical protein CEW92_03695 [Bacillaceae bacterium SAS-127]
MEGTFLLSFLKPNYKDLAVIAEALEKQVYSDGQSVLSKARLFAEKLAKCVMETENISVYYDMKHVERVQKLYREGLLNEEIHFRFEWIRKMGNKAVHEMHFGSVEDALKAHRFTYDLAVWFMELYGDFEFEAPKYESPKPIQEKTINTEEITQTVAATLEKTLEAKLQEMQEELFKLTQEKEEKKELQQSIIEQRSELEEKEVLAEQAQFDLMNYLQEHNIEVIDKRSSGGTLWLLGGWELKEVLDPLKAHRVYFRFTAKGGRATRNKPAWFLMGKTKKASENAVQKSNVKNEAKVEPLNVNQDPPSKELVFQKVNEKREFGRQLIIPAVLKQVSISEYADSPVSLFGKHLHLETFGDIQDDHLRQWYRRDKQDFHNLVIQLWFLGCEYEGNLAKLVNLSHDKEKELVIVESEQDEMLSTRFPPNLVDLFAKFGVRKMKQLNGLPVLSVKWLTMESFQEFLGCLKRDVSNEKQEVLHTEIEERETTIEEFTVYMGKQCLSLPASVKEVEITTELIAGCNNFVRQLRENFHIHTIGELPKDLLLLREQMQGVGPKVIEKFFKQLAELREPEEIEVIAELMGVQGEEVILNGERVEIPAILQKDSLEVGDFLSCPSIIEKLNGEGIYAYNELPIDLLELKKLPGVGNLVVKKFFEHVKEKVKDAEKREADKNFYSSMTEEERMAYELQSLQESLQVMLDTGAIHKQLKINEKALSILRERYEGTLKGKRPTLEESAQNHDVTRERIRQIVKNSAEKIRLKASVWLEMLQKRLECNDKVIENNMLTYEDFCQYLLLEMLESENVYMCFNNRLLTTFERNELQDIERQISSILTERLKGRTLKADEYGVMLDRLAQELAISSLLVKHMSDEMMYCTAHNEYVLSKSTKADIAEMVLRQFPNGVEVYKEYAMLNERANAIIPDLFRGERDFPAICTRDEFLENVHLWGRGIYIHKCFVTPDEELIEMIAKEAESKLRKKLVITVTYLFEQYKDALLENNVPTEYALYSLLRRYGSDRISLPKFPKVIQIGGTGSIRNADLIRGFIRSRNQQVSVKEIRDEFITNSGWKPFTVEFTLSSTKDIIQSDFGYYTLLEFYQNFPKNVLEPIALRIEEKMNNLAQLQISGLFKEFESYCIAHDIHTSYLLYYLLRSRYADRFMFPRYPHIVKPGSELESISITSLVEEYILEQGYEVSREEVMDWLVNEVGARENALDVSLRLSNKILYYTSGQYAEYVHEETIGWNREKKRVLKDTMLKLLEREQNVKDNPFVLVEQGLLENLPELDGGLPWTSDLLIDCLKKDEQFLLLGSKGMIVVDKMNANSIQSDADFIQYVLVQEFGGSAKVTEIRKKLIQYNFSHDGELLFETETLLAQGEAPFIRKGDELISKHLMEM